MDNILNNLMQMDDNNLISQYETSNIVLENADNIILNLEGSKTENQSPWINQLDGYLNSLIPNDGQKNIEKVTKKKRNKSQDDDEDYDVNSERGHDIPISLIGKGEKERKSSAKWTPEEDQMLIQMVATHGMKKWQQISRSFPGREGKRCRERYVHHLAPNIKKDPWTKEEESKLIELQRTMGNKWVEMTAFLPGRSDNAIKNFWNSGLRRRNKPLLGGGGGGGGARKETKAKKRKFDNNLDIIEDVVVIGGGGGETFSSSILSSNTDIKCLKCNAVIHLPLSVDASSLFQALCPTEGCGNINIIDRTQHFYNANQSHAFDNNNNSNSLLYQFINPSHFSNNNNNDNKMETEEKEEGGNNSEDNNNNDKDLAMSMDIFQLHNIMSQGKDDEKQVVSQLACTAEL